MVLMNSIEAKILETVKKMPPSLQEELLHYAEYLLEKQTTTQDDRVLGKDKGLFIVPDSRFPIPDDFNDPLPKEIVLAFESEFNDVREDFCPKAWHEAMTDRQNDFYRQTLG